MYLCQWRDLVLTFLTKWSTCIPITVCLTLSETNWHSVTPADALAMHIDTLCHRNLQNKVIEKYKKARKIFQILKTIFF